MVKVIYLCMMLMMFGMSSCKNKNCHQVESMNQSNNCYTWIVDNQELKEIIYEFHKTAEPVSLTEKLVVIHYYLKDDGSETYCLTHILGAYSLRHTAIHLLVEIEDIKVGVNFEGVNTFKLSEQSLVEIMKEVFPRDYEYYQSNLELNKKDPFAATYSTQETLFPPPVTGHSEAWVITFKDGQMIDNKVVKRW